MTLHLRPILLMGLLSSALLCAAPPTANAGQIFGAPTYIGLNSGLVSWWTFNGNDMHGATALDPIGKNQGSLLSGAARTIGILGQAIEFDGVDDRIDTTTSNGLHNLSPMTISLWIRPRSFGESNPGAAFLSKGDQECFSDPSIDDGWTFGIAWQNPDPGQLCFQAGFASGNLNVESPQDTVTLNEWQHVVLSWDGTAEADNVLLFRNANAVTASLKQDGSGARNDDSGDTLTIGANDDTSLNYDGLMDDIRIYNRVLSADEIKRLYKIGSTQKIGAPNSTGSLSSGLVGWWTMDGADTSINNLGVITLLDRSGNGGTAASLSAAAAPLKALGKIGQALTFDGSNDRAMAADNPALDIPGPGTIASWFKLDPAGVGTFRAIATKGEQNNDDTNNYHLLFLDNDALMCNVGNGSISDSHDTTFTVTDSNWHHIVCTWDGSAFRIYLDGVFREQSPQTVTPAGNTDRLQIGSWGPGADFLNGVIDDLRIYNRAITADEIKRLYKIGSTLKQGVPNSSGSLSQGLVGWWTFDGKNIAKNNNGIITAFDMSGSGNHATSSSSSIPLTTFGKIGQALQFASSTSATWTTMQTKHNSAIDDMSRKTISLWVYSTAWGAVNPGAGTGVGTFLIKKNVCGDPVTWELFTVENARKLYFEQGFLTNNGNWYTPDDSMALNKWQHIVVVYDRTSVANHPTIYIDGVSQVVTPDAVPSGSARTDAGSGITIGTSGSGDFSSCSAITGKIDDLRIYDRLLSADEVKRLYNMGR